MRRSYGPAPGPSGAGPRMKLSWKARSRSSSNARNSPLRSPKRRNSVPLPTPAEHATSSIVTPSTPRSETSRWAAHRIASRLRAASARSVRSSSSCGSASAPAALLKRLLPGISIIIGLWSIYAIFYCIDGPWSGNRKASPTTPNRHRKEHLMSATATVATRLPAGTWKVDPTHSSATFAVKHMAVGTFRGGFENLDAALIVSDDGAATLQGTVRADSIDVKDENLRAHLGSPDF